MHRSIPEALYLSTRTFIPSSHLFIASVYGSMVKGLSQTSVNDPRGFMSDALNFAVF